MKRKPLLFLLLFALLAPWAAKAQQALPYSYGFEDNNLSTDGWTMVTCHSSTGIYSSAAKTGSYGFRFYYRSINSNNPNQYLVSPELTGTSTGVTVSFYYKNYSSSYAETFQVGYSTSSNDPTTFTYGNTYSIQNQTWTQFEEDFPANTKYIGIKLLSDDAFYLYLDDFSFTVPAACPKPTLSDNVTTTSSTATITWTPSGANQTSFDIYWSTTNTDPDETTTPSASNQTGTSYQITNLNATTTYYVWLRGNCGNDGYSDWTSAVSFTTPCTEITTFPWSEDFTGLTSGIPDCWDNSEGTTTYASYKWSYYNAGHDAAPCLRFNSYSNSSGLTNFLKTPALNFPTGTLMQLVFWYKNPTGGDFSVFISTDGGSTYTTALATALTGQSTWAKKEIDLTDYIGSQNVVIVFKGTSNYGSGDAYIYLDDVTVREKPNCLAPTALAADASTNSAELSWTANSSETAWTVYYKKTTDANYTEEANATNPYPLNGLTASTNYQYYVVANCSDTDASEPSEVFTFATECDVIAALGYSENFDSYTVASNYTGPSPRVLPTCWNAINTTTYSSYSIFPTIYYYSSTNYANSTPNSLKFYSYYSSYATDHNDPQPQYAILPEMSNMDGKQITLWAKGYNASSTLKVGRMTDPTDASTFSLIQELTLTTSYQEFEVELTGTGNYIALMIDAATSSRTSNGVYVDDIVVENAPTCKKPSALACNSKTAHTATLSWTNGEEGQNAWQIAYSTNANFNPDEVTPVDVTHNPDTLTGLDANTTYYAYVRANCGNNDYSPWCRTYVTFKTNVGNATPTLTVDQSSITYNSAKVTWTAVATNDFHESYELYYSQLSTRPDPLQADSLITGITDLNYVFTRLNPETKYYVWLRDNCGTDGLSDWSSSKNFTTLSACVAPNNLRCLNTTTSSATLSWFERGDATEWVLTYMTERDTIDVRVDENPYMLTGLADGTDYSVKVRPICSETAWSSVVSFTTPALCPAPTNLTVYDITGHTATMNWVGTSNSYIVGCRTPGHHEFIEATFEDGALPADWTSEGDATWSVGTGDYSTNTGAHGGSYNAKINHGTTGDETYLVTPNMDLSERSDLTLGLWYINRKWVNDIDGFGVYYRINGGEWNEIFATTEPHSVWTQLSQALPEGAYAANCQIGFKFTDGYGYGVSLDDITLGDIVGAGEWVMGNTSDTTYTFTGLDPETLYEVMLQGDCVSDSLSAEVNTTFTTTVACPAPTDLHYVDTTLTAHEVMLSWTETGLASEWQICVNDDMDNLIPADTTSYMLTNLDQDTDYSVKVRANCGDEDGTSTWSNVLTFHTLVTCAVPTNLAADSITTSSALLSWNGTSDSYVVQYSPWNQVGEDQIATGEMVTYTYDLSGYTGTGSIAIRHYDVTNMFYLIVDDIVLKNAQDEIVFSENFESTISSALSIMDLDGDGYNWELLDSDSYYLVNDNYGVGSASYTNNVGPLTPDNWLIISGIELGGQISFAARGQDAEWPAENFGVFVSADSDYTEVTVNDTTKYLAENLMPNTPYAWQVKGVCGEDESRWAASFFTTLDDVIVFTTDGNWNEASNWTPATVPTSENNVRIEADAIIPTGVLAEANKVTIDGGSVTIKDGGQMKQNSATLQVTMEKVIAGYGEGNGNYYLIASPFSGRTLYSSTLTDWNRVDSLFNGSYDLYTFDPANGEDEEWVNYKEDPSHINYQSESQGNAGLLDKEGYLYANEDGVTLTFIGNIGKNINITENKAIAYEANKGWALVGNIFACNAYLSFVDGEGEVMEANYWVMNATGDDLELAETTDGIAPITAAFINFGADGYVQINSEEPTRYHRTGKFSINLSQDGNMVDKAVVRFGKGLNLEKMSFKNNSKLYFSMKDKDYAVVYTMKQGEMPVSFKAEKEGTYTIDFSAENVSFNYLVLIDNETGEKIDLIANPSYTFEAKAGEFARRFTIVYETK